MNQQKVSEIMAAHYYNICSNASYWPEFRYIKEREENIPINFDTNVNFEYNKEI